MNENRNPVTAAIESDWRWSVGAQKNLTYSEAYAAGATMSELRLAQVIVIKAAQRRDELAQYTDGGKYAGLFE